MSLLTRSQISFDYSSSRFDTKTILCTTLLVVTGALNTIMFKMQTKNYNLNKNLISIQVLFVFLGQYINFIIFYSRTVFIKSKRLTHFRKYKNRALMGGKKFHFSSLRIGFASFINLCAMMLYLYSFHILSPSIFQMLLGSTIIFTPILSKIFLKKPFFRHTIAGMFISIIALILIFVSQFFDARKKEIDMQQLTIACCLMVCGLFLSSCQRVYEEWLLKKIETSAFRFVGIEGLYGILFISIFHIITSILYTINQDLDYFNIGIALNTIKDNISLIVTSIVIILSSTIYDLSGIVVTRKISATYRVVFEVQRTIIVWIIQIILYDTQEGINDIKNYILVQCWQLFSYCLLIIGNLLLNELKDFSFCNLDKYYGRYNDMENDETFLIDDTYGLMQS